MKNSKEKIAPAAIMYGEQSRVLYTSREDLQDFNRDQTDGIWCGSYNERYDRVVPLLPVHVPTVLEQAMQLTGSAGKNQREQELLEMITALQVALQELGTAARETIDTYHSDDNGRTLRWAVGDLKIAVDKHIGAHNEVRS